MSGTTKSAKETENPILLTGVYRSGTSILQQMVNAHPSVELTYDAVKFLRFVLHRFDPIEVRYEEAIRETQLRLQMRWNMEFDGDAAIAALVGRDNVSAADVYSAIMRVLLLKGGTDSRRWGEKNAMVLELVPDFFGMFPRGQVLHIIRDPRDATASYKKMTFEVGNTFLDCSLNCLFAMRAARKYIKQYGEDRYKVVRLEDLTENPERTARSICQFLGLEYSPQMIDHLRFRDKQGKVWKNNSAFEEEAVGFMSQTSRWKTSLSEAELTFVELVCGSEMQRFNYQPTGTIPSRESWMELHSFFDDPYIKQGFEMYLATANGRERYRTDPIAVELDAIAGKSLTARDQRTSNT